MIYRHNLKDNTVPYNCTLQIIYTIYIAYNQYIIKIEWE